MTSTRQFLSDNAAAVHPKVWEAMREVDEADALFMLGACASFVSYLIMRSAGE